MTKKASADSHAEHHFTATIQIDGINPYVDVPGPVVAALGSAKAAVLLKLAAFGTPPSGGAALKEAAQLQAIGRLRVDGWFRTSLVPQHSQPARLYLDQWQRGAAGVKVGDEVAIALKSDRASRDLALPESLRQALEADAEAAAAWEALTPARRREILTYLNFLKTPAALARNVEKTLKGLKADQK